SLDEKTRGKLCLALAGLGVNLYLDYPYIFPGGGIQAIYDNPRLQPDDVALLSDYQALLGRIPTMERRVAVARALSRQPAVFAGLVIKPDTDIDKIAAYW